METNFIFSDKNKQMTSFLTQFYIISLMKKYYNFIDTMYVYLHTVKLAAGKVTQ